MCVVYINIWQTHHVLHLAALGPDAAARATPNVGPTSLADDAAAANLLLLLPLRGAAAVMTLSGDGPELDVDGDATVRGKVPATLAVTRLKLPRADAPLAT